MAWLTGAGVEAAGLGGVRAVKSPPAPTTIAHGVLVGWSAARMEHRGRVWKSARELALDRERWAVPTRCDRGFTEQLPDLAAWRTRSGPPVALIAESGGRREDRRRMLLEGWLDAIWADRYSGVQYDCASPSVARWIARLAKRVGLDDSTFTVVVQPTAAEIAALPAAAPDDEPTVDTPEPSSETMPAARGPIYNAAIRATSPAEPTQPNAPAPPPPPPEAAEAAAERERHYRELLGMDDPKPRRRWRR